MGDKSPFESLLTMQLNREGLHFNHLNLRPDQLKSKLMQMAHSDKKEMTLIQCNLADYIRLLRDPEIRSVLAELQLELANPGLISTPLYLLGYSETGQELQTKIAKKEIVQVAILTLSSPETPEDADLLNMISEILSRPKNTLKLYRERQAYTAAKQLFDGHYDLVGIYEDQPSTILDEFQINLMQELNARAARELPVKISYGNNQLREVSPTRLSFTYVVLDHDSTPVPAIVLRSSDSYPALLSNIHSQSSDVLPNFYIALSNAYYLMGEEISKTLSLNERQRDDLQHGYLLNSYLLDPVDRYKALAYLGSLLLRANAKTDNAQEKDTYLQKCSLFLKEVNLQKTTARDVLQWLNLKADSIEKRDLFTDDVSHLYQSALLSIQDALSSDPGSRKTKLMQARNLLIAALLIGDTPKEVKGGRGLWSAPDYNPYYQLGRVDLYLKQQ